MTGAAAAQMGIRDRGLIRERYLADLVVFNPDDRQGHRDLRASASVSDRHRIRRRQRRDRAGSEGSDGRAPGPSGVRAGATAMIRFASPSLRRRRIAALADARRADVARDTGSAVGRPRHRQRQADAGEQRALVGERLRAARGRTAAEAAAGAQERRDLLQRSAGDESRADAGVDRAEGRAVRAAPGGGHGGIERRVPERGSVLSQRVLAVARRRRSTWDAIRPDRAARRRSRGPASSRCSARSTRT